MKRIISMPQAVRGAAFGWGALLEWAAARNDLGAPAIIIFFTTVCWAAGYDTIYALLDRDDDLAIGVRASAILFGRYVWAGVGALLGLTLVGLAALGPLTSLGAVYAATIIAVAALFGRQTWLLRRGLDRVATFGLFRAHAAIGLLILAGMAADMGIA